MKGPRRHPPPLPNESRPRLTRGFALLLSALAYPGAGQWALGRRKSGLAWILIFTAVLIPALLYTILWGHEILSALYSLDTNHAGRPFPTGWWLTALALYLACLLDAVRTRGPEPGR